MTTTTNSGLVAADTDTKLSDIKWQPIGFIIASTFLWYAYSPLSQELTHGFAILGIVATLWLSEAIHLSITALIIPILGVLLTGEPVKDAFSHFAHPIIYLFLGGFALAAALSHQGLDQKMAQALIQKANGHAKTSCLFLCLAAAGLSMWMNNTATTALMLPLLLGIIKSLPKTDQPAYAEFGLLGLAYSASIGGMATLIGTAPNALVAAHTGIDFTRWLMVGLPTSLLLLGFTLFWLNIKTKPRAHIIHSQSAKPREPFTTSQKCTLFIFISVVCLWMLGGWLGPTVGVEKGWNTLVAIGAMCLLGMFKLFNFQKFIRSTEWDVLILFGGGLCMGTILKHTGVSAFMGSHLSEWMTQVPSWLWILMLTGFVIGLTEFVSNTASTALLIPIFLAFSDSLGAPPEIIAGLIALSASCAFMLPVATPPNAIVFSTGKITQKRMMRIGIVLNLFALCLISSIGKLWLG